MRRLGIDSWCYAAASLGYLVDCPPRPLRGAWHPFLAVAATSLIPDRYLDHSLPGLLGLPNSPTFQSRLPTSVTVDGLLGRWHARFFVCPICPQQLRWEADDSRWRPKWHAASATPLRPSHAPHPPSRTTARRSHSPRRFRQKHAGPKTLHTS